MDWLRLVDEPPEIVALTRLRGNGYCHLHGATTMSHESLSNVTYLEGVCGIVPAFGRSDYGKLGSDGSGSKSHNQRQFLQSVRPSAAAASHDVLAAR